MEGMMMRKRMIMLRVAMWKTLCIPEERYPREPVKKWNYQLSNPNFSTHLVTKTRLCFAILEQNAPEKPDTTTINAGVQVQTVQLILKEAQLGIK